MTIPRRYAATDHRRRAGIRRVAILDGSHAPKWQPGALGELVLRQTMLLAELADGRRESDEPRRVLG